MARDRSLSERLPTRDEAEKAGQASAALARHVEKRGGLSLRIGKGARAADVDLPPAVGRLVLDLLQFVADGQAVTLVPFGAELSTQQAAGMLNVSRPFVVKLIEDKQIPHHMVGTHRRVRAEDVLAYRQRRDRTRNAALTRLARLKQEIDG